MCKRQASVNENMNPKEKELTNLNFGNFNYPNILCSFVFNFFFFEGKKADSHK